MVKRPAFTPGFCGLDLERLFRCVGLDEDDPLNIPAIGERTGRREDTARTELVEVADVPLDRGLSGWRRGGFGCRALLQQDQLVGGHLLLRASGRDGPGHECRDDQNTASEGPHRTDSSPEGRIGSCRFSSIAAAIAERRSKHSSRPNANQSAPPAMAPISRSSCLHRAWSDPVTAARRPPQCPPAGAEWAPAAVGRIREFVQLMHLVN